MAISRDDLFKAMVAMPQEDYDFPGVGILRIRALSRAEVLDFRKAKTEDGTSVGEDPGAMERLMISSALVEPQLSESDVWAWQRGSIAGALEPLTDAIAALSGMKAGAGKEAVKRFRE